MKSTNTGSIKMSILLSILLALSGMAVMALADQPDPAPSNKFSGNVTLNGADAFTGVVIDAYIDGDHRGTITVESSGKYGDFDGLEYLDVIGNASDDGKTITFTVCGAAADQSATWYEYPEPAAIVLDLTAVDDEAPAVTNATATPSSIVANGVDTTQLNVTVIDGCRCTVGNVTVNLSAIGGLEAKEMTRIGDTDVYTVTVNATEGTALGAYCLPVNASDMFGNYDDTSVCIALDVTTALVGDLNGDTKVDIDDLILLGQAWGTYPGEPGYNSAADINDNGEIDIDDLILLGQSWTG